MVDTVRADHLGTYGHDRPTSPEIDRIWSDSATVRTMQDGSVQSGTAFESDMSFENLRIENMRGGARRIF